jgi:hypothetical protein
MDQVSDDAFCEVRSGGATRTRGFWQTHGPEEGYTCYVLGPNHDAEHPYDLPINFGFAQIENCADALGVFWSNNARTNDGNRRDKVCQAKVNASKQLMAAILNARLDNGANVPMVEGAEPPISIIDALLEEFQKPEQDQERKVILYLMSELDAYNNSGDFDPIVDFDGVDIPHADPNGVRDYMDETIFDDCF